MRDEERLTAIELATLVSVYRLGGEGYGVTIRGEIEERTGRSPSIAAVYAALERLESRGSVEVSLSEPLPERGGRARRHYRVSREGVRTLREEKRAATRLWEGVEPGFASRPR